MKTFFFFCCLSLFITHTLRAQLFPFRQYTSEDELANSDIYDMMQDSEGYLWFATDNGVSRFDGSKFTNYGIHEGLTGIVVSSLCIDEHDTVWAATKGDGIVKFNDGKFELVIPDTANAFMNDKIIVRDNILYSLRSGSRIYAFNLNTKEKLKNIEMPQGILPFQIYQTRSGKILCATAQGIYSIENLQAVKIHIPEIDNKTILYLAEDNDTILAATKNELFRIYKDKCMQRIVIPELKDETINNIITDDYGATWLSTYPGNKLYIYKNDTLRALNDRLQLFNTSVNDILKDAEGNIWLATYGRGIYCFHHLYCTNYNERDGLSVPFVTALHTVSGGDVIVGTYNGISYYDGEHFEQHKLNAGNIEYIKAITGDDNDIFVSTGLISTNAVQQINGATTWFNKVNTCFYTGHGEYIYGKWSNTIYFGKNGKIYDSVMLDPELKKNRINSIFKDKWGNIWCGTWAGLYVIEPGKLPERVNKKGFNNSISVIAADSNDVIWIGCDKGLFSYTQSVSVQQEKNNFIFSENKNKIQHITSIIFDKRNRPWVGTLSGLYVIENNESILLDANSCLLSEEVQALAYNATQNFIWVGTNAGLSRINIAQFDALPSYAPKVSFRNIRTQDGVFRADIDTVLPYDRNNFTVRFSAIHFTNPIAVKFLFQVDDGEFQPATGRQVEFAGLGYGKHKISLIAENDRGLKSEPDILSITIATPYWVTWWFRLLTGLIVCAIIFYIIRWRFIYEKKKQKQELELQTKISELRHQALNTSMNPHFIFNSLNSIQQFINTHNAEEASEYLGKFARLIRLQLNSGNKTFITLDEELDRMNRYLELEKIRFGDKLNYNISVQSMIDAKNIEIPNMILQPFVENAIWHGILPLQTAGKIAIDFTQYNGTLKVCIEDNGIGIKASEQRKKNTHRSLGMQMITERIQLLKKLNGNEISIQVKDISEMQDDSHGTRIEIELPLQHKI